MAKKSATTKNDRKRNQALRRKKIRDNLRKLIRKGSDEEANEALYKLHSSKRNDSLTRVVNRCRQCGRPHGVLRKFGMCRICVREAIMKCGDAPGARKASW